MSPRKYELGKRRAAVEQTRARILDATMQLHAEQGILNTSWEDIAGRAGVAVGTVYRHFPTLQELVPACGEVSLRRFGVPRRDDLAALFDSAATARERIRRLVAECYGRYERAGDVVKAVRRRHEREQLPPVAEAHREIETALAAMVDSALAPLDVDAEGARIARAICDFDTWQALSRHGLHGDAAVDAAADLLLARLA